MTSAAAVPTTLESTVPLEPLRSSRDSWVGELLIFAFGAALMLAAYGAAGFGVSGAGVPGNDSYYHLKMAEMLPEVGLLHEFPWLRFAYFTDEGHAFVSHHYGFHVLLAPFVHLSKWITDETFAGGRWFNACCMGVIFVLFARLVREGGGGSVWVWLPLIVLLPFQFFTRHAFIRAITPSLAFMLLICWLLFRGRSRWLAVAIAAYIHLYMGGVLFAPLIVGAWVVADLLIGERDRRILGGVVVWAVAGWVIGIVTHPYRAGMLEFLRLQVFGSGLSPDIPVGKEWKPYDNVWWFMQMSGVLIGAWLMAVVLRLRQGGRLGAAELCLFLLNIAFGVLTAKARRFIETWPIFCLLSAIYMAAPCFAAWGRGLTDRIFLARLRKIGAIGGIAGTGVIVALSPVWREIRSSSKGEYDLPAIRAAMTFLRENAQPGDVVFTDDWDIFPLFFHFNSHNHYIVGLDPKFTHARDPELWERYVKISRGQTPAEVSVEVKSESGAPTRKRINVRLEDIREHFGAKWVVADRDHSALARQLESAGEFAERVYPAAGTDFKNDAPYLVFRVR